MIMCVCHKLRTVCPICVYQSLLAHSQYLLLYNLPGLAGSLDIQYLPLSHIFSLSNNNNYYYYYYMLINLYKFHLNFYLALGVYFVGICMYVWMMYVYMCIVYDVIQNQ